MSDQPIPDIPDSDNVVYLVLGTNGETLGKVIQGGRLVDIATVRSGPTNPSPNIEK